MLILASTSPTRKSLLERAGVRFSAESPELDERRLEAKLPSQEPSAIAEALGEAKARAVARRHPGAVVIGGDQVLALGGASLHKATSLEEARARLDLLRGRTHQLVASVALVRDATLLWRHTDIAELDMRDFTTAERDAVLAAEGPSVLGSVGAYRLEGPSVQLFSRIAGDYFTVLGLPLLPLLGALQRFAPESLVTGELDP